MKKFKSPLKPIEILELIAITILVVGLTILVVYLLEPQQTLETTPSFHLEDLQPKDNNVDLRPLITNPKPTLEESQIYFEVIDDSFLNKYIGKCRLTVYTPHETSWGYVTATGKKSMHLMTCAVDPKVIPYNSIVVITDKDGEEWRFKAIDCGNFSGNWIDIFFDGSEKHGIEWLDEVFGGDFANVRIEVPAK